RHHRGAADGGDVQNFVDDAVGVGGGDGAQAGIVDALDGIKVGLRVGEWGHTGSVGQGAQAVQPFGRGGLAGARVGGGAGQLRRVVGGIGHDITGGHRVDGDQQ